MSSRIFVRTGRSTGVSVSPLALIFLAPALFLWVLVRAIILIAVTVVRWTAKALAEVATLIARSL